MLEPYADSDGGERHVLYFEKARMEITDINASPDDQWYVSTGLIVDEMVSGKIQVGHTEFEQRSPADIAIAGDLDDLTSPTYDTLNKVLNQPAHDVGTTVDERLDREGNVTEDVNLTSRNVTVAYYVAETQHGIADPFWAFMNSSGLVKDGGFRIAKLFNNPFYATGYPITEPYWVTVNISGVPRDVLLQCFQRRCLTYTPDNPKKWRVETTNVGLHYFQWRYESAPPGRVP
jgi:hypothetical protein